MESCRPFSAQVIAAKNHKLIYQEKYEFDCKEPGRKVLHLTFIDPQGKTLATQISREPASGYVFDTDFHDSRDGYEYEIAVAAGDKVTLRQREGRGKKMESTEIARDATTMNFPGALKFINENLGPLEKGEKLSGKFIIPSRQAAYSIVIQGKPKDGKDLLEISIQLRNPLYAAFAPRMVMTYDLKRKVLLHFSGNATLLDENDKPVAAEIDYR